MQQSNLNLNMSKLFFCAYRNCETTITLVRMHLHNILFSSDIYHLLDPAIAIRIANDNNCTLQRLLS